MNTTLKYYNNNADLFYENTAHVDMGSLYAAFLGYLPQHAKILDLGCGSGRDTLYFKNQGHHVAAIDYAEELVARARALSGVDVAVASFYDLNETESYDGIWACASLLHCDRDRLTDVLGRILTALKPNGVCYMSFKYGQQDREIEGRHFTDLNEAQANALLKQHAQAVLLQQWISVDQRPDRHEEWLNLIWKRSSHSFEYYPQQIYSRREIIEQKVIPKTNGVYFWWFKNLPDTVPFEDCIQF
ncbi:methyltransferase family protein [Acinetobacter calcoaceticus]|uniref:Methyltransferase family protein n=1 Tax=Acinetobacter calcoaceticus TaxID=471 RepID=A0A4R1XIW5_ACICA|nr:methyltransferase family protein [Acinetobacter calcoaceticus]